MWLTARNVPEYLIEQGLLSPETLLNDDLTVEELSQRNRNFRLRLGRGGGFFLKQAAQADPLSVETQRTEAQAYGLLREGPTGGEPWLPTLRRHDVERHVLIFDLLSGRESLGEFHRRELRFPPTVGRSLGETLASLHRTLRPVVRGPGVRDRFPNRIPWVLNAGTPEALPVTSQTGGSRELVAIVQRYPEIRDQLGALRAGWAPDTLIHGDVKWDNCLVAGPAGPEPADPADGLSAAPELPATSEPEAVHLVDWEMADVGDPAWDVGGVFQSYLSYWAFSLPAAPGTTASQMVRTAPFRLDAMQPAMRACWDAYRAHAGLNGDSTKFLRRSVCYAAARAIQTAYESLYTSAQLTPQAVLLLQVSSNMLARPEEATHELVGI